MNKKSHEMSKSQSSYRWVVDYEDIPDSFWTRQINTAKKALEELPLCITHCPKSSECKKLLAYEKKLQALREVMQPRLGVDVKDARKRLAELISECRSLYRRINRCIYVRKHLTEKGYHMWDI